MYISCFVTILFFLQFLSNAIILIKGWNRILWQGHFDQGVIVKTYKGEILNLPSNIYLLDAFNQN